MRKNSIRLLDLVRVVPVKQYDIVVSCDDCLKVYKYCMTFTDIYFDENVRDLIVSNCYYFTSDSCVITVFDRGAA